MAAIKDSYDISDILRNVGNPNVDHSNVQSSIVAYNVAAIAIASITVLVRTSVRAFIVRHVALEDWLMVAAGLTAVALSATVIVGVNYGFGRNIWDLNLLTIIDNVTLSIKILFVCQLLHGIALSLVKLSIISTYWRLFPTRNLRRTLFVLAFLITAVAFTTLFGTLFQCRPVAAVWDFSLENGTCGPILPLLYFSTSFSIFTDIFLCILPLPFFWKLRISHHEKIIVSCLFGLGLFAAAASVLRLTTLDQLQNVNVTMRTTLPLFYSVAEVSVGIVCACVPCLKPLFNRIFPGRFFTYLRSASSRIGHAKNKSSSAAATITTTDATISESTEKSQMRNSEVYIIQGPGLCRQPSQKLAHLSTSGSGVWRGRGVSWYDRPILRTVGSWRDGQVSDVIVEEGAEKAVVTTAKDLA